MFIIYFRNSTRRGCNITKEENVTVIAVYVSHVVQQHRKIQTKQYLRRQMTFESLICIRKIAFPFFERVSNRKGLKFR